MAEQAPEAPEPQVQQSNGKKKPKSKFGMMMGSMGRSAKKGMARAGRQMAKGAVKAKQAAAEKIAKVTISDEDPEIISALERLKITKTEVYAISDIARNLYEARLNEATFLIQLADKLKSVRVTQNDPFTAYVQKMGVGLSNLEQVQSEHLKRMEEELVVPLEKFRDLDVEKVQKLKLKYKSGKTQYDIAAHKLTKAQESQSQDPSKIQSAQAKKDAAYTNLTSLRNDLKFQVNNLEQKKQVNLLGNMEQYWSSYAAFASAQSNILSQNTIHKDNYVAPVIMNGDEVKNEGYDNDNNNNNNTTPPDVDVMDNDVPPPPNQYGNGDNNQQQVYEEYDDNYNQYDDNNNNNNNNNDNQYVEDNNVPTEDYNPFDD